MSAYTQTALERMTVPALKDLLKPTGLKPARLKKDLIEQILATRDSPVGASSARVSPPTEGGRQVAEVLHPHERAVLREIFIDIWNKQDRNGEALRGLFTTFFGVFAVPYKGTTPVDVANVARDFIVTLL